MNDRFWSKVKRVDKEGDTCWYWLGCLNQKGYGHFTVRRGLVRRTHRISYELHHNITLKSEDLILHTCDNRRCVNPDHLYLGSALDNYNDAVSRDRLKKENGLIVKSTNNPENWNPK